jgi:glycine/D-amino acid oxidase-like deaminating enzyme/nitrite reductase/ring-hydroxylating ferredoxin subunit
MDSESGKSISPWLASVAPLDLFRLQSDARADVCVVGAGIAGLSTAYELARAGRSVIVIDQARIGDGMTGRTTAHFTNAFDDRYARMIEVHGLQATQLLAESHTHAIERTAAIATAERMECELERIDGYLFAPSGGSTAVLEAELDAAEIAGVRGVELMERAPLGFDTGPALRFPDQLQLHPLKYLHGLARAILRMGGRIYTHTHADTIEGGPGARVQTEHGPQITASSIVVATNSPVNDLAVIHSKQSAWQTYAITVRMPCDLIQRALYWDTGDPYHYLRLGARHSDGVPHDLLIVGGEDHRTGQEDNTDERWTRLEAWVRVRFPSAGAVVDRWSGEVLEPADGVAYIGRNPIDYDNVFVVTGDSGNGMTHGVIAGVLLRDLIDGKENPWTDLYDPARYSLRAAGTLLKENLIAARTYAAWLAPGEADRVEKIPRGHGAIVRRGLKMLAVYVDDEGHAHTCSAACPHMGAVVRWNHSEKSWDCPCHGSRFDALGKVIHGPAIADLAQPVENGNGKVRKPMRAP